MTTPGTQTKTSDTTRLAIFAAAGVGVFVLLSFVGLIVLRFFYLDYLWVPQDGMYPTVSPGDKMLAWRGAYRSIDEVERGDVVVFVEVRDGVGYFITWRVLGRPGDRLIFEGDRVLLDGEQLERTEIGLEPEQRILREEIGDVSYLVAYDVHPERARERQSFTVPPDHLFLVGDNRDHAHDSRQTGPVPFDAVPRQGVLGSLSHGGSPRRQPRGGASPK